MQTENRVYRVVWNAAKSAWQAVSEIGSAHGKTKSNRKLRCAAVLSGLLLGGAALAGPSATQLPTGGAVVGGSATISTSGSRMDVVQTSQRSAIDWNTFNIGSSARVHFAQPAGAVALNRVLDTNASQIYGKLTSTGQIFLVNPNGIFFAPGAQVEVGGLIASTLGISRTDFMDGKATFQGTSANAIINQGNIKVAAGGTAAFIAAKITNSGRIDANQGNVLFGAGSQVTLDMGGPVKIQVERGILDALIEQGGAIKADGGTIYLSAKAAGDLASTVIKHIGTTEAQTLVTGEKGQIVLLGDSPQGRVEVSGTLDAGAATGQGGTIDISSHQIWLKPDANLITRGAAGGGNVRVGGGWQGNDASLPNAHSVQVAADARVDASAVANGNAGTVVFWADDAMRFAGQIKATGGAQGGLGGMVEVSGKNRLAFSGRVDTSAPQGSPGLLLLDPQNLTILAGSGASDGNATAWADSSNNSTDYNIYQADLEALSGAVVLHAAGTITIQSLANGILDMSNPSNPSTSLTMNANTLTNLVNAQIKTSGTQVYNTNILLGGDLSVRSTGGAISFKGTIDGAHNLDVQLGTADRVVFNAAVGATTPLTSLTTGSLGQTYVNANITTTGAQTYNNSVLVGVQGVAQFENGDLSQGSTGWTYQNVPVFVGTTSIGGFTSPTDSSNPAGSTDNTSITFPGVRTTTFSGGSVTMNTGAASCNVGFCIVRGPFLISNNPVSLLPGDSISFDWKALAGGDAYDVFGYLLNTATGSTINILNSTGTSSGGGTNWATATKTLGPSDPAGNYKFVFVAGSYDFSGGRYVGGELSVDNIATTSTSTANLFGSSACTNCTLTSGSQINLPNSYLSGTGVAVVFNVPQTPVAAPSYTVPLDTVTSTAQTTARQFVTGTEPSGRIVSLFGPAPVRVMTSDQGNLPVFAVAGGLAFVDTPASALPATLPTAGPGASPSPSSVSGKVEIPSESMGTAPFGFMRVFVVNGGLNLPEIAKAPAPGQTNRNNESRD